MTDLSSLTSWHADWKGLRVVVLGLSVTGFSVADTLSELGAEVLVATERADAEYGRSCRCWASACTKDRWTPFPPR